MSGQQCDSFAAIRNIRLPLLAIHGCAVSTGAQSLLLVDIRPEQQVPLTAEGGCLVSTAALSQLLADIGLNLRTFPGCLVSTATPSQLPVDNRPVERVPLTATGGCPVSNATPLQQLGISGFLS
jgi:hypothetical protein